MNEKRKAFLEKRQKRLEEKREALKNKGLASTDAAEVRAINDQISDLNEELTEIREELATFEASQSEENQQNERQKPPANAQFVNGGIVGSFNAPKPAEQKRDNSDPTSTLEYRQAFMKFVQDGTPIPPEARAGVPITTQDSGYAIPLTIMNEVINTVRVRFGNLYNKVRKTNVKGGVEYPIGALKATFKWINESTVSPRQKLDPLAKVSFSYHTAEIRIAQTFLSAILTMEAFEAKIVEVIASAVDDAIVHSLKICDRDDLCDLSLKSGQCQQLGQEGLAHADLGCVIAEGDLSKLADVLARGDGLLADPFEFCF